jgi:hypothetical protein
MGSAISLRSEYDGDGSRHLARQTRDADQARVFSPSHRSMMAALAQTLLGSVA